MRADPKLLRKLRSLLIVSSGGVAAFTGFSLYNENEKFYQTFVSPAFQCLDPEVAHRVAVLAAKYKIVPASRYQDPEILSSNLWKIQFSNPIGLAAGFDKDSEAVTCLHKLGFGFVEIGSVTPLAQPGNEKPRVFRLTDHSAVINRYGFNSQGHDVVLSRIESIRASGQFQGVIGVNLGKNKTSPDPVQDYVLGIKRFAPVADYLVINISSPNTPGLRDWQQKEHLETLLRALIEARNAESVQPPLLLKLSPDLSKKERKDIAEVIIKPQCKVDGLIISNTTIDRPGIDNDLGSEPGGLSGAPLHIQSTQLIRDMYSLTNGQVTIIGVGGVFSGKDAFEKIQAGASLIELYTAFSYHGPPRIVRIKKELHQCLREAGFSTIVDAVGSEHKRRTTS